MHDTRLPGRVFTCRDRSTSKSRYRIVNTASYAKIQHKVQFSFIVRPRSNEIIKRARRGEICLKEEEEKRGEREEGEKKNDARSHDDGERAVEICRKSPALINFQPVFFERARLIKQSA